MGTGYARRRCRHGGVDCISGLPDELLHSILLRLPSTADAARTSVLARRWRRVWAHVPALSLREGDNLATGASIPDAALAAHAAPALDHLAIAVEDDWYYSLARELGGYDLGARVCPWQRYASRRVAGELSLRLHQNPSPPIVRVGSVPRTALNVPVCERATTIDVDVHHVGLRLRFRAAGGASFAALRVLTITGSFRLHKRSLERAVSSQCPRLQELTLCNVLDLDSRRKSLTIRSDSLQRLKLGLRVDGQIIVQAPRLVRCEMPPLQGLDRLQRAHIAAPNLAELTWYDTYDPRHNRIVDVPRHLQRLEARLYCLPTVMPMAALLEPFDTVDELDLLVRTPPPRLGLGSLRLTGYYTLPSRYRHQKVST